jgi:hypothetical protein
MHDLRIREVVLMPRKKRDGERDNRHTSALTDDQLFEKVFHATYGMGIDELHAEAYAYIKRTYETKEYDHILLHPSGMMLAMTVFLAAWQEWQSVSGMMDRGLSIAHHNRRDDTWSEQVWWGRAVL